MNEYLLVVKEERFEIVAEVIELNSGEYVNEISITGSSYEKANFICNLVNHYKVKKVIFDKERISVAFMDAFMYLSVEKYGFRLDINSNVEWG